MIKHYHGMSSTPIYRVWRSMRTRCENPSSVAFKNYGGRGITVCDRWRLFENFHSDMGDRPPGHTIERVDNDKGYSPDNCIWATRKCQSRNRRNLHLLTVGSITKSMGEWSELTGISVSTIWNRLKLGWTDEEAVTTPLVTRRKGIKRGERIRDHQPWCAEKGVHLETREAA